MTNTHTMTMRLRSMRNLYKERMTNDDFFLARERNLNLFKLELV